MAKKLKAIVRLQLKAGKANPAPPVGPALAGHGINIMAFCKEYNARTSNRPGEVLPAEITVYTDNSFTFVLKTQPAAVLLRKAAGVPEQSASPATAARTKFAVRMIGSPRRRHHSRVADNSSCDYARKVWRPFLDTALNLAWRLTE